jgi:hypothetical protein
MTASDNAIKAVITKERLDDPLHCQTEPQLTFLGFFADSEERYKRGERQVFCTRCEKWRWPDRLCADATPGNPEGLLGEEQGQ